MASVVLNAFDLEAVAGFWGALLGVEPDLKLPGFIRLAPQAGLGVGVSVQAVADRSPERNRVHLDLASGDPDGTRPRVIALGGKEVASHTAAGFEWTVFADPEGNEFCVATDTAP